MEKTVYYNDLFDIYGFILTSKNIQIFKLYYEENLTMQEIADLMKVSKSFIGNSIKKSQERLKLLESKLHIYENKQSLTDLLEENNIDKIKEGIEKIITKY